jgi:[acyl-carrier-protein] S-malonyltransferase
MTYEDGLRLIKTRAEAMQSASNEVNSGMMSVFVGRDTKLTLAMEAAREWCNKYMKIDVPCVQIANHMYAECKVLAGHKEVRLSFYVFLLSNKYLLIRLYNSLHIIIKFLVFVELNIYLLVELFIHH